MSVGHHLAPMVVEELGLGRATGGPGHGAYYSTFRKGWQASESGLANHGKHGIHGTEPEPLIASTPLAPHLRMGQSSPGVSSETSGECGNAPP